MKRFFPYALGALILILGAALAGPLEAQSPGQQQGQQPPPQPATAPAPPAPPAAPLVNKEEEDAYKAFFEIKGSDPEALIASGEDFLKKFPESRYRESVHSRLTQAFLNTGQLDKLLVSAEKALELNPDNVDVLSVLSYSMLRRFNPNDLDAEQKLEKAEKHARHGIELLDAMQRPAHIAEEEFARAKNDKIAMCRSGLGLAHLHRQRYSDAAVELEMATKLMSTPDPTDLYLLGAVYQNARRYPEAADAFGRCGDIPWAWQDRCKQSAERARQLAAKAPATPAPKP